MRPWQASGWEALLFQDKPELLAALQTWGLRKRPVTRWGFSGEQVHPKFADKGI